MHNDEFPFIEKFFNLFKKKLVVHSGDVGIYTDVITNSTLNNGSHALYYDIYVKVRAMAVYDNLIEIEVIDFSVLNTSDENVIKLISSNIPKYIKPKHIKWEVKPEIVQG